MKGITVNELMAQLQTMQDLGLGEHKVIYIDDNDMTWNIIAGVYNTTDEHIVLG